MPGRIRGTASQSFGGSTAAPVTPECGPQSRGGLLQALGFNVVCLARFGSSFGPVAATLLIGGFAVSVVSLSAVSSLTPAGSNAPLPA